MPAAAEFDAVLSRHADKRARRGRRTSLQRCRRRAAFAVGCMRGELAAIVIDPMPSRAGLIKPDAGIHRRSSGNRRANDILVIADEVLNLRQGFQGASARYGLVPDLDRDGQDHRRRPSDRRDRRPQRRHEGVRCVGRPAAIAAGRDVLGQSLVDGRWPRGDAGAGSRGLRTSRTTWETVREGFNAASPNATRP